MCQFLGHSVVTFSAHWAHLSYLLSALTKLIGEVTNLKQNRMISAQWTVHKVLELHRLLQFPLRQMSIWGGAENHASDLHKVNLTIRTELILQLTHKSIKNSTLLCRIMSLKVKAHHLWGGGEKTAHYSCSDALRHRQSGRAAYRPWAKLRAQSCGQTATRSSDLPFNCPHT